MAKQLLIAIVCNRINQAYNRKQLRVDVPYSLESYRFIQCLHNELLINGYRINVTNRSKRLSIHILLKYKIKFRPLINFNVGRITSRFSLRCWQHKMLIYRKRSILNPVTFIQTGTGYSIHSTASGRLICVGQLL